VEDGAQNYCAPSATCRTFEADQHFGEHMRKPVIVILSATFVATVSANATTCSEAVARCKIAGASKPYIDTSCDAAGAACMKTGRFRGPVTNMIWPDHLIRR
jgi:hypothetical protein